jgi:hypothetical protein
MSFWAILFRSFLKAQNDLKLHNARERTIKLKDLNMIAQSDLKLAILFKSFLNNVND